MVLGTGYGFPARAVPILNCWALHHCSPGSRLLPADFDGIHSSNMSSGLCDHISRNDELHFTLESEPKPVWARQESGCCLQRGLRSTCHSGYPSDQAMGKGLANLYGSFETLAIRKLLLKQLALATFGSVSTKAAGVPRSQDFLSGRMIFTGLHEGGFFVLTFLKYAFLDFDLACLVTVLHRCHLWIMEIVPRFNSGLCHLDKRCKFQWFDFAKLFKAHSPSSVYLHFQKLKNTC